MLFEYFLPILECGICFVEDKDISITHLDIEKDQNIDGSDKIKFFRVIQLWFSKSSFYHIDLLATRKKEYSLFYKKRENCFILYLTCEYRTVGTRKIWLDTLCTDNILFDKVMHIALKKYGEKTKKDIIINNFL